MIKILFICLGNICRSPMAEFVFKDLVEKEGLSNHFFIQSAGTCGEVGSHVHYGTQNKLQQYHISTSGKVAMQLKKSDYKNYDYLIAMETRNVNGILRIVGNDKENKIYRLLDFSKQPRDIADPWYTGNFDVTYDDVYEGCLDFLTYLKQHHNL